MLTQERLKELLRYNPYMGIFYRRIPRAGRKAGSEAGHLHKTGYVKIKVDGVSYMAHRLAWLYMKGEWPEFNIDHINRDKADNKWLNLRDVPQYENCANADMGNTSGRIGVYFHKERGQWCARIYRDGKSKFLGRFDNLQEAIDAREVAELEYLEPKMTIKGNDY